ncbi:MAG: SMI1/KNR4 family protein [Polyangiaceae bacterium]|nr:SMI1/KNR4 family protein [Polyangiaceae bacterium]
MTREATDVASAIMALDDDFGYWVWTTKVSSRAAVQQLEADLGVSLPSDYLEFVVAHGAIAVQAKQEVWQRPKPYAVGPRWAHDYGLEVYGIAAEVPPPLDIRDRRRRLIDDGVTGLTPLAGVVGSGATLALDESGRFVWLHGGELEPAAGTFTSILLEFIERLKADKEKAKQAGPNLWT